MGRSFWGSAARLEPIQVVPETEAVRGVRLSLLYGKNTAFTGFQANWVNVVRGDFEGLQYGLVSTTESGRGLQRSAVNHSRNFRGLQFALVNYAERLHGVQIGLINIIQEGGVLPVMPLVNRAFDESDGR